MLAPVTLAQRPIDAKTNEITEVRPLLQPLDLRGKVVTADAMHTQVDLARFLARDKDADYVFTVKAIRYYARRSSLRIESFPPPVHGERKGPRPDFTANDSAHRQSARQLVPLPQSRVSASSALPGTARATSSTKWRTA